jgi:hypothetical protein
MGGYGSGQHHANSRTEVENCHILSAAWLLQNGYLDWGADIAMREGGCTWSNIFGDALYTASFGIKRVSDSELLLNLYTTGQSVTLWATPQRFGGVRWWFECPRCWKRCAKLYLPDSSGFACRVCHDLTYRSCNSQKYMGYTTRQLALGMREKNWFRYPPWRRKRDRRPDYRDRGAWLREIVGDRILL